jgi:pyrroline-5-carboxylate reductase
MRKIGIIGFGNMGSALASGLKERNYELAASDTKPERRKAAARDFGLKTFEDKRELIEFSEALVLTVKPQELEGLIEETKDLTKGKRIISIIAGRRIETLSQAFSTDAVSRFMPNLAARYGMAMVGVSFGPATDETFRKACLSIAGALGVPCEIPETLMPAITGLSASGIGFVFAFLHALSMAGVATGFAYSKAREIAIKTVEGAVRLMQEEDANPVDLMLRVASPAGTTVAGIASLEKNAFAHSVIEAVTRAAERARDLEL